MVAPGHKWWIGICLALAISHAASGQTFDLSVPGSPIRSIAQIDVNRLTIIDAQGAASTYVRDRQFDTSGYLGFSSTVLQQTIRWPASGSGRMQIASGGSRTGAIAFRASQMVIAPRLAVPGTSAPPRGGIAAPGVAATPESTPSNDPRSVYRIESAMGAGSVLAATPRAGERIYLGNWRTDVHEAEFRFLPTDNGYVQMVSYHDENLAVGIASTNAGNFGDAMLFDRRLGGRHGMEFRFVPGDGGFMTIEMRQDRDFVIELDNRPSNLAAKVRVGTRHGLQNQLFRLVRVASPTGNMLPPAGLPPVVSPPPRAVVSQTVVPETPLEPVMVELYNSHAKEIWVLVTDFRDPNKPQRLKIPANKSKTVEFDRDAGSRIESLHEVRLPGGGIARERRTAAVAPKPLYEISVYELIAQSTYIDRTRPGTAPEIDHAPRSVGSFVVPATFQGGRSDIYQAARRQNNAGGVRRLNLEDWDFDKTSPRDAFGF